MESSCVNHALEIVKAQASVRTMTSDEVLQMLQQLTQGIVTLVQCSDMDQIRPVTDDRANAPYNQPQAAAPAPQATQEIYQPVMDPSKSIRARDVTCLVCGKVGKVLTKKHLATHGLTPASYKAMFGMSPKTALVAKSLAKARAKKMEETKIWERRKKVADISANN